LLRNFLAHLKHSPKDSGSSALNASKRDSRMGAYRGRRNPERKRAGLYEHKKLDATVSGRLVAISGGMLSLDGRTAGHLDGGVKGITS
jgi:hypothetical protein